MDSIKNQVTVATRTTLIGSILNCLLGIVKILVGLWGQSHALVADGFHSLSDLVTDFFVFIAARIGGQSADREHPYGHGRIETLTTTALSLILFLVAISIAYDAVIFLIHEEREVPKISALIIIIISILIKEWLFIYTKNKADEINSKLLMVHAWHHRSDVASSIVVFIGICGGLLGFPFLDAIAAIIVACLIGKVAFSFGLTSIRELVDTAVSEEQSEAIQKIILNVDGVKEIHQLKTRLMGGQILVDVHVIVSPKITVSEGHFIGHCVRTVLQNKLNNILNVMVHIDPEDDEQAIPTHGLKLRGELISLLSSHWKNLAGFDSIQRIDLHYLSGKITVDLFFPFSIGKQYDPNHLKMQYMKVCQILKYINSVNVFFS